MCQDVSNLTCIALHLVYFGDLLSKQNWLNLSVPNATLSEIVSIFKFRICFCTNSVSILHSIFVLEDGFAAVLYNKLTSWLSWLENHSARIVQNSPKNFLKKVFLKH